MRDDQRHIPLRIRMDEPRRYAKGGLASHAEKVRGAGRYGDDMIVHINKDEFNQLRQAWGEPTINPKTGAPEYFLSGLRKWFQENPVASAVLPAATSILLPGLGQAVGSALNIGGVLGSASNLVGNGLVGAGLGAITGGGQGALIGGATGAIAPYIADGIGSLFGSGSGASTSGVRDSNIMTTNGVTGGNSGGSSASSGLSSGLSGALASITKSPESMLKAALGLGTIASAFHKTKDAGVAQGQANTAAAQEQFNRPLPQVDFNRQRIAMQGDPRRYGTQGGQQFFANNALPTVAAADGGAVDDKRPTVPFSRWDDSRTGGALRAIGSPVDPLSMMGRVYRTAPGPASAGASPVRAYQTDWSKLYAADGGKIAAPAQGPLSQAARYVQGPGTGRSDEIPAMLSDGEYVMDSSTVAMLGDGSNKAGAQRLDEFRKNLWKHKGGHMAKGKISPNAKSPMSYLSGKAR